MAEGTLSADGDGDIVKLKKGIAAADGTFGGGTLTVMVENPASGNYAPLTNGALTSDGAVAIDSPFPINVKLTLAGATTPSIAWSLSGTESGST